MSTDDKSQVQTRGFLGDYVVAVKKGGTSVDKPAKLLLEGTKLVVTTPGESICRKRDHIRSRCCVERVCRRDFLRGHYAIYAAMVNFQNVNTIASSSMNLNGDVPLHLLAIGSAYRKRVG